jgi:hypothetical protein
MHNAVFRKSTLVGCLTLAVLLSGCVTKPEAPKAPAVQAAPQCSAVQAGDPFIGTWLAVRKYKGLAGELHVLMALSADGTMAYSEQLKRGKTPARGLSETGCWHRDATTLTLQTTKSNGMPVELDDPIYSNKYTIRSPAAKTLLLLGSEGELKARRMPDGYRLPY